MAAAVAPNERFYVAGQAQPFTSGDIVCFLKKLCGHNHRKNLLIIWRGRSADGATIHRSQAVEYLLRSKPGRIHVEKYLFTVQSGPPPWLNPAELLWSQLKGRMKNVTFMNLEQLTKTVTQQINLF
ncbi:transposase [Telluribacter sp. SYSU D00476]|uniref:transposase n=1 Tax=Telluribacter sp. SYSU D00476 TaxID=2811430 RepID=UPI0038F760AB